MLDIVLTLWGEILSSSLMGGKGFKGPFLARQQRINNLQAFGVTQLSDFIWKA